MLSQFPKRGNQERVPTNNLSNKPWELGRRDCNASSVVASVYLDEDTDLAIAEVVLYLVEGVDVVNQYAHTARGELACEMDETGQGGLCWWNAIEYLLSRMNADRRVGKTILLR